jgi:predicted nucleic acid-binding protein
MTTAVDTSVIVALWDRDDVLNSAAQSALDAALERGSLTISAPVFAELRKGYPLLTLDE